MAEIIDLAKEREKRKEAKKLKAREAATKRLLAHAKSLNWGDDYEQD